MARAGALHWVGAVLLLAASILLLITTISAPVINNISLLRVTLSNGTSVRHSSLSFGTFGYCVLDAAADGSDSSQDWCSDRHIGYSPTYVMSEALGTQFSGAAGNTADGLTRVMVLHPVACAIAFIAFLIALIPGVIGSLVGSVIAAIAFILSLVAMAVDFSLFAIVRDHIRDQNSTSNIEAHFDTAIWTILAATILLFIGMFIVLFTCCSARRAKRRDTVVVKNDYGAAGAPPKSRFGRFGRRGV